MKHILTIILIQLFVAQMGAQTKIQGKVEDSSTSEAIAFADISLFEKAEDRFIKAYYSDEDGNFVLDLIENPSQVYLEIQALGYQAQRISLDEWNLNSPVIVKLEIDMNIELAETVVTAKKNPISVKGDKVIYHLDQMGISAANNGLETMQQLPGISLDNDENIKFRGSTGIQIMINGKKSMLQGDALREFIRSLKADDIKEVEIISQPSARYEASGTTGILNIVLKKNVSESLGGNLYSAASKGEYFRYQNGGRFFYNDKNWSINANASYYKGKSFNDRDVDQTIELGDSTRYLSQNNYWLPETETVSFNFGVERKLNKNQLMSTEWQIYNSKGIDNTTGKTSDYLNDVLQEEVRLTQYSKSPTNQVSGNVFYNFTSDSLETKIDAQVNYSHYKKSLDGFQENAFSDGTLNRLDGNNETEYNLLNAQVDWNQKLTEALELEVGGKFSNVEMNYFNNYTIVKGDDFIIPDILMVNDFVYKEKLASAYTQLNYNQDAWSFLIGLRMENYDYEATSKISNETNKDNYTHWFPSASVGYRVDNNQYRLSYSRRISRPNYLSLNPYYHYLDSYSVEKGNPDLKPQIYHSFELNYVYKSALSFGLYGYLYNDKFVNVVDYQSDENYNIVYQSNSSNGSRFGFSAAIPYEVGDWWVMQFNFDAYLSQEKSEIPNYEYDGKGYGYEFSLYHKFNLPQNWSIFWNGFYSSRNETPTGYSPAVYDMSASLRKSFLDDKLQWTLGVSNLLKKSMWNTYSTINNVTTHWVNRWETRSFYTQLTYVFGGNKDRKVKKTSLGEEQNRI